MKNLVYIVTIIVALLLAACNLPGVQPTPGQSVNEQAGTLVAATLQAAATATSPGVTPFASPVVPQATPTAKLTLSVNTANAECRGGPSSDFPLIATLAIGTKVDLAGKDSADGYYIVVDPTSHNLCWLPAQDGKPSGSTDNVLEVTPPAGATSQKVPVGPAFVIWSFSCEGATVTVNLSWTDKATNETGYHIYRDGNQIADLPPNSSSYTDTTSDTSGGVIVYGVAAYNDIGSSPQAQTASAASGKNQPVSCQ